MIGPITSDFKMVACFIYCIGTLLLECRCRSSWLIDHRLVPTVQSAMLKTAETSNICMALTSIKSNVTSRSYEPTTFSFPNDRHVATRLLRHGGPRPQHETIWRVLNL